MENNWYTYRYAVVRGVPDSYKTSCIRSDGEDEIDIGEARRQHATYVQGLRGLGLEIVEVPADERYPDCVFVEDAAIVVDKTALVCHPGAPTRVGEEVSIREALQNEQLGLKIVEIEDPDATIEGGDVMFTGREILVGLSSRTNQKGVEALAKAFPDYPVTACEVPRDGLHLKSVMTMISDGMITVSLSQQGRLVYEEVKKKAKFQYEYFEVEEDKASNVLLINGTVVHVEQGMVPKSWSKFVEFKKHPRVVLGNSEFTKADGCLSCRSILIR